eukprot:1146330-Pelagomonas_calceolata.AAC.2
MAATGEAWARATELLLSAAREELGPLPQQVSFGNKGLCTWFEIACWMQQKKAKKPSSECNIAGLCILRTVLFYGLSMLAYFCWDAWNCTNCTLKLIAGARWVQACCRAACSFTNVILGYLLVRV